MRDMLTVAYMGNNDEKGSFEGKVITLGSGPQANILHIQWRAG